jgi:hypothetical protein
VIDKIKNQTHPEIKNYWTPLYEEEDETNDKEECQHDMNAKETIKKKNKPRNRPGGRQRSEKAKQTRLKLVIDSGATSHFLREEENLPKIGGTSTTIYLPDDSTMKATIKVQLPIPELPNKARDAIVVPGQRQQILRGRIHHSIPPRRRGSHNPCTKYLQNHNNYTTDSQRVQKQWIMDSDS